MRVPPRARELVTSHSSNQSGAMADDRANPNSGPGQEEDMPYFAPLVEETFAEKFTRKFKADPLVPIGAGLTGCILLGGLNSFAKRSTRKSAMKQQNFMRARVGMQGLTVAILAYGTFYSAIRANFDKKEREAMGAPRFKDGNETFAQAAGFQERARKD